MQRGLIACESENISKFVSKCFKMAEKKGNKEERLKAIRDLFKEQDICLFQGLPVSAIAEHFGVSQRQIYLDIREVIQTIPNPNINYMAKKFQVYFDRIFAQADRMSKSEKEDVRERGVRLLLLAMEKFTFFLEKYGYKKPILDETPDITEIKEQLDYLENVPKIRELNKQVEEAVQALEEVQN